MKLEPNRRPPKRSRGVAPIAGLVYRCAYGSSGGRTGRLSFAAFEPVTKSVGSECIRPPSGGPRTWRSTRCRRPRPCRHSSPVAGCPRRQTGPGRSGLTAARCARTLSPYRQKSAAVPLPWQSCLATPFEYRIAVVARTKGPQAATALRVTFGLPRCPAAVDRTAPLRGRTSTPELVSADQGPPPGTWLQRDTSHPGYHRVKSACTATSAFPNRDNRPAPLTRDRQWRFPKAPGPAPPGSGRCRQLLWSMAAESSGC